MCKFLLRAALFAVFLSLYSLTSFAQTATGEIRGTVSDPNGAVVPGATVEVTNDQTGVKNETTSNDAGLYVVPQLPVGVYTVTVTQSGFAPASVKSVNVSVAFSSAVNITLNPGGGTETVTVQAGDTVTQVNTTDQQLSTLLDNKKILDLPLLNRDPNGLVLLAPGTIQTNSALGGFSVNGSRERNNNFLVDGVDNNDAEVPGIPGGAATPNIDATQEFRVLTGSFNAESGRNSGAIITVATKNGTNDFHGGAYIYYRSDQFAARDFFDVSGEANPLQQKQFGASIGGPIKKDKAFFFFNYEGLRQSLGSQQSRLVPSASARTGILNIGNLGGTDFGTLNINSGSANNIRNLPANAATLALINSIYPLPNGDIGTVPGVVPGVLDTFTFGYTQHNTTDSIATRIDYRFNSKHTLTGSFNYINGQFDVGAETFPGLGDTILTPQRSSVLSLTLVSTLSPSLINEAHFGLNRIKANFFGTGDHGVPTTLFDEINSAYAAQGIPLAAPFGGANGQRIDLVGTGIAPLQGFDSQRRFAGTTSAGDSVTWVKGNHTFKMGGEYRWVYSNSDTNFGRAEQDIFSLPTLTGEPLLLDNGGNPIDPTASTALGALSNYASFYYGLLIEQTQSQYFNTGGLRTNNDLRGFRTREWDLYFQDQWRIRPNLSINLGLRYERQGVPFEVNGQLSTLVNQDPSGVEPAGGFNFQLVGQGGQKLYEEDKNNFAPRFGFNWSPGFRTGWLAKLTGGPDNMSIRGGYGIYYDRIFGNLFDNARGNPPFQQDFLLIPGVTDFGDTIDNIPRPPTQTASSVVPSDAEIFPTLFALPGNNQFQSKFVIPYEQKWSLGFQRSLGNQFLLEADYVGGKGTNELRTIDGQMTSVPRVNAVTGSAIAIEPNSLVTNLINGRLNDAFFQVALNLTTGFSTYNALQTRLTKQISNRRFGTGSFQVAYTWSHSIDDATDGLVPQPGERSFPRDSSGFAGGFSSAERGDSGFDIRHRMVANFDYDLPFKFENRYVEAALGNFTLAGIFSIQSGTPYSIFGNTDSQGTGVGGRADFGNGTNNLPSPNIDPNPRVQTGPSATLFANPCPADSTDLLTCEGPNLIGRQGTVARNSFRGPAFNSFNLSVIKRFPITEKMRLRIQADFFNMFNRVNFAIPDNQINNDTFGRSLATVGNPRIIQFAARFEF
jgi:hypothetical protein